MATFGSPRGVGTTVETAEVADGAITNAKVNSAAEIVDTKLATISTAGKVSGAALTSLASIPSGAGVIPAANVPPSRTFQRFATIFETAGRFSQAATGSGTATFGTNGLLLSAGATGTSSEQSTWNMMWAGGQIFAGSPVISTFISMNTLNVASGAGSMYVGIGEVTVTGSGHTFTNAHIGFKILKASGVVSLYATQADNTTENASSALTTLAESDGLDLIAVINSTTSVDYYWRKVGGSLSAATNLTTNLPTAASIKWSFSASNNATAFDFSLNIFSANYER